VFKPLSRCTWSYAYINTLLKEALSNHINLITEPSPENKKETWRLIEQKILDYYNDIPNRKDFCPDFIDYKLEDFDSFSNVVIQDVVNEVFTNNQFILTSEIQEKLKNIIFTVLKSKEINSSYTGLIFVGYGEDEIYPSLIPLNISLVIQSRLRFFVDSHNDITISDENNGAIRPFAQTDVIDTILSGIDPKLDEIYHNSFGKFLFDYNQYIISLLGDQNPLLTQQIKALNIQKLLIGLSAKNQEIKKAKYVSPLMNTVGNLSKEDLAEMAESLIYLTYLKRRMTNSEESVGGPVDVAIISKGDGFIWIKRKLYFKPELNQHFFSNYFN
jgi:hypothetical protein